MTQSQRRVYVLVLLSSIVFFCALAVHLLPVRAAHAPFLNLDFEVSLRHLPCCWFVGGVGFDFTLDNVDFYSGAQSLRMRNVNAPANTLATASLVFLRGKGTAWFDNLEVFIDGVPLEQGPHRSSVSQRRSSSVGFEIRQFRFVVPPAPQNVGHDARIGQLVVESRRTNRGSRVRCSRRLPVAMRIP